MKKLILFTGAGISAESGIKTFRDKDGLWEKYRIEDVATPEAWERNPAYVQEFYNFRRKQLLEVKPNAAHLALVELEKKYDVQIITQNIDDLHERAGSQKVLHLHGELLKSRSSIHKDHIYPIQGWELKMGEVCELGSQLRPHIVWFGELVPEMNNAADLTSHADVFICIGTSLNVYPAAGLISLTPDGIPKYLVDPGTIDKHHLRGIEHLHNKATEGVPELVALLMKDANI